MSNRWTNKELSEMDDITFAMCVLSERCAALNQEAPFAKKIASAYHTLDALRGGLPINITDGDTLSALRERICSTNGQNEQYTSSDESSEEPDEKVSFRVEYETSPIRHLAVRCPHCEAWMRAQQASSDHIPDMVVAEFARYECVECGHKFCPAELVEIEVEECDSAGQVYRDCVG